MKKLLLLCLAALLFVSVFTGCNSKQPDKTQTDTQKSNVGQQASSSEKSKDLKKLRVAVMPFFLSAPVDYIKEQGWDKEAGLDIETVMFSNGATMNEALAPKLWDVAPTGGAAIFGVAAFGATFIADFVDGTGGNELWVRADSDIVQTKGFNPTFPTLLGSPDSVKGKTLLYTAGTTSQMTAVKYLEAIGVKNEDVNMVHLEFPQVYQGFLAGTGDVASMVSPYVFMAPDQGWVQAASLKSLGASLYETVIAAPDAYKNMKEELAIFLKLLYKANAALESDKDLKFKVVKSWYEKNGTQTSDDKVQQECDLKSFITEADLGSIEYGKFQKEYAEFLTSIDKLTVEQIDVVVNNTKSDILDLMKEMK